MKRTKTLEISDEFWAEVEPLIPTKEECRDEKGEYKRKSGGGRKRKYDDRTYFSAIVYVLRTGIIWNALPLEEFGELEASAGSGNRPGPTRRIAGKGVYKNQ